MQFTDLRDFIDQLEQMGELKRVTVEVEPNLEITEICDRTLRAGGPALLFERPTGHSIPVLANLFGTPRRVAMGMGEDSVEALRDVGRLLAMLKEPEAPKGMKDAWSKLPVGVDRKAALSELYPPEVISSIVSGLETANRWGVKEGQLSLASKIINSQVFNRRVREYIDGERSAQETVAVLREDLAKIQ